MRAVRSPFLRALLLAAACLAVAGAKGARETAAEVTAELQKKINAAIDKGQAWLKSQRASDGSFQAMLVNGAPFYQIGVTSLCGLALLAAGESKKDPAMQQMVTWLKGQDAIEVRGSRSTYSSGALIMFLTELYRPDPIPDKDKGRYAKPKTKDPCGLTKEAREWVEDLCRFLAGAQLDSGWWRYPAYPPADLSNTQYALLGLRAARDCGVPVPMIVFLKALQHTLEVQEKDGPKVRRIIPSSGKPGETDYAVESGDRARGWTYQSQEGQRVTGAMTTAGIAALAICRDALKQEKYSAYTDEMERHVGRSVQDGFAWLDSKWAVDQNPPPGSPAWHYYYLYGLERACAFAGREKIGSHDWYAEGAAYLVDHQKPDGRWTTGALGSTGEIGASDLCDTAWALLFLKRATRPTIEIKPPVVTSGG